MVLRLCLCAILLFACGYANKSSDYCRVLVNYDTFKTSVDQFLASRDETCENKDMSSESKATTRCMAKRVNDLENEVEKLSNDNENKEARLGYVETALANLTSELNVDCGSPPPQEGTDVVYSSTGFHDVANYRCKKGFVNIQPFHQKTSFCQKDGNWTMVNLMCVNLSGCWTTIGGKVLYTGTRSTSVTGKVCQRWDSQTPHSHDYKEDAKYWIPGYDTPQTVTGSANYCRDPSLAGFVWCYTTDRNSRWEKCAVPKCNIQE